MNKITKIFNNIGFLCSVSNNTFIQHNAINGYKALEQDTIGYFIPYLIRNIKDGYKWETGVGEIQYSDGLLVVKRIEVTNSSNNNKPVNFIGNENEFYLFVNNNNFNSSFNNVIVKNDHFTIDNVTSIYLVDNNDKNIDCVLPDPKKARNIVIDIKALSSAHNIIIRDCDGLIFESTSTSTRLVCDGQAWYSLNQNDQLNFASLSDDSFSSLSNPGGAAYSFQYNDGSNGLLGSELYWSSGNTNKLLLGSSSESLAHTVIPTSGSANTIFNQDLQPSDFIVYGSGQPYRNLFFSYDGRVGINIPSGSRPQTIFHVVNYSCSEILRLENRTTCQPAKLTVYHKPSSLSNGGVCSILNLAGRDVNNNQKDYATIYSIASDTTNGNGGLVLTVSSGSSQQPLVSGSLDSINLGYSNNKRININNNGNINISGDNIDIRSSTLSTIGTSNTYITLNNTNRSISLDYNSLLLGTGSITSNGTLSTNNISSNTITLPNIATSSLLTISNNKTIVPINGITVNSGNNGLIFNNISGNKFLTTDSTNNLVGLYDLDDYFLTEKDITWNKYTPKIASVCLKQVILSEDTPIEEFSVGDQVEIITSNGPIYRNIASLVTDDVSITEIILDQNVSINEINNITIASITKGGYLKIQKFSSESSSDNTSIILSTRPGTETIFNTAQKDIDFTVYGADIRPALKVHASVGSITTVSGTYHNFATKDDNIKPIVINTIGSGLTNNFSTANYNYNLTNNLFSGILSSVGTNGKSSYYGTYDQNGNVAEWIESDITDGIVTLEYAAGGSYRTPVTGSVSPDADSIYLRGIQQFPIVSAYDYVGFRVASISNLVDNPNISNSSSLNLSFVNVINENNIADTEDLYLQFSNNTYQNIIIPNLGVVDKNYRIGRYEVTNKQYVQFLNSVATGVGDPLTTGLYNTNMTNAHNGGILRSSNGLVFEYSIKPNMADKPVNYVNYINSLQFINWLHNDAPEEINPNDANSIINDGAYTILLAGSTYYITTNNNRKYFLPNLNQWHKAAYFEYQESIFVSGSPAITMGTFEPYVVATELLPENSTDPPKQVLANVTVSGWLVVDKIFVRDGTVRSSLKDIGFVPDLTADTLQQQAGGVIPPLSTDPGGTNSSTFWNNNTSSNWGGGGGVYGETNPPPVVNADGTENEADCDDELLIIANNIPHWCRDDGRPGLF